MKRINRLNNDLIIILFRNADALIKYSSNMQIKMKIIAVLVPDSTAIKIKITSSEIFSLENTLLKIKADIAK